MRRRFIVCYDISAPKRLARTFRNMKGFGDPLQKSVFTCDLSAAELEYLGRPVLPDEGTQVIII